MIEIFLSDDYDKDLLKAYLRYIKESASRELTYDIGRRKSDVTINKAKGYSAEEAYFYSSQEVFKNDLVIFINDRRVSEYTNGEPVGVDTIYTYIKEM